MLIEIFLLDIAVKLFFMIIIGHRNVKKKVF
jgi:hypothetical protein